MFHEVICLTFFRDSIPKKGVRISKQITYFSHQFNFLQIFYNACHVLLDPFCKSGIWIQGSRVRDTCHQRLIFFNYIWKTKEWIFKFKLDPHLGLSCGWDLLKTLITFFLKLIIICCSNNAWVPLVCIYLQQHRAIFYPCASTKIVQHWLGCSCFGRSPIYE